MTAKRVRSRKSKAVPKEKPPKLSAAEKKLKIAEIRTAASRARRAQAHAEEANRAILPPPPVTCNDEELRFIDEYMRDLNGSAAIIRAGIHADPKVAKVYASRYLDRPHVLLELAARRSQLQAKNELSLERVLEELRRVGITKLSDVASWNSSGVLILHPKEVLTDEQLSAIASIEEIPGMFGSALKVKMHNKVAALKDLRKHLSPSPAESRFGALGGSGGSATIVIEGGPTGLEINIHQVGAKP